MKKKNGEICSGGIEHPTRKGVKCWGNHNKNTEGHWAYINDPSSREGMRRISWRTET